MDGEARIAKALEEIAEWEDEEDDEGWCTSACKAAFDQVSYYGLEEPYAPDRGVASEWLAVRLVIETDELPADVEFLWTYLSEADLRPLIGLVMLTEELSWRYELARYKGAAVAAACFVRMVQGLGIGYWSRRVPDGKPFLKKLIPALSNWQLMPPKMSQRDAGRNAVELESNLNALGIDSYISAIASRAIAEHTTDPWNQTYKKQMQDISEEELRDIKYARSVTDWILQDSLRSDAAKLFATLALHICYRALDLGRRAAKLRDRAR